MSQAPSSRVPLVDLKVQYAAIKDEVQEAINRVLDSSRFILGQEVVGFEEEFASYCQVPYALGVANGTAALHLALLACGVGPGDEVITTPLTFVATAEAITQAGALPVFVDVDPITGNLDPHKLEAAITTRTRAIMPVHLYGNPADMDPILEVARARGIKVIEDAAQAHGALYKGRRTGTMGDVACFSFYPGKNLGAYGDAGALVASEPGLMEEVRRLRDHGRIGKYNHLVPGYNYRMDSLQAAILRVKLAHLDGWNQQRRMVAELYRERLAALELPLVEPTAQSESAYHLFVLRVQGRDQVLRAMVERGVEAGVHYPIPVHLLEAYRHLGYGEGSFPVAEVMCREVLSLPMYPELTAEQVDRVVEALEYALGARR